jgi:hypothetical protein
LVIAFDRVECDLCIEARKLRDSLKNQSVISKEEVVTGTKSLTEKEGHSFWLVWKRPNIKHVMPRYRHPTQASALKEAERISLKYPESKIYVLEAVAKFENGIQVDYPVPNVDELREK